MAMILALSEGLKWLGCQKCDPLLITEGKNIETAIKHVIRSGTVLTYDLIGEDSPSSMSDVTTEILTQLDRRPLIRGLKGSEPLLSHLIPDQRQS